MDNSTDTSKLLDVLKALDGHYNRCPALSDADLKDVQDDLAAAIMDIEDGKVRVVRQ